MIVQTGAVYWSSQSILLILYMFNLPQEYEVQSIHFLQNSLLSQIPESRLDKSRIEFPSPKSLNRLENIVQLVDPICVNINIMTAKGLSSSLLLNEHQCPRLTSACSRETYPT